MGEAHRDEAKSLLQNVVSALTQDEHVTQLQSTLRQAKLQAIRLLTPPAVVVETTKRPIEVTQGKRVVERSGIDKVSLVDAKKKLASLDAMLKPKQTITVSINWIIEEDSES